MMARATTSRLGSRRGRTNFFGYLFIAPALALYAVFSIWPILRGILMSFTDYRFFYPDTRWAFNGVANFTAMLGDSDFWESLGVSARYTLMVLPLTIVIAFMIAVLVSKVARLAGFYRWMFYLPVILPVAVTYLMFGEMYNFRFGLVNAVLKSLGMAMPPNWLGAPQFVLPAIGASDIWRSFGFPMLLFLVGIYAIDADIFEAAAVDGANAWQQMVQIMIPLLKPVFLLVIVLNLAVFPMVTDPMLLLTAGGPQNASRSLGLYAYQTAFQLGDLRLGYAAAMNLVLGLLSAGAALIVFWLLRDRAAERAR